jgi:hypothetical protein
MHFFPSSFIGLSICCRVYIFVSSIIVDAGIATTNGTRAGLGEDNPIMKGRQYAEGVPDEPS